MSKQPIRCVPKPPRHERSVLTYEEWKALLAAARQSDLRDEALVLLMYEAGLRASEVGLLRLENCQRLKEHFIYVHRVKGSQSSWLELSPTTCVALARWMRSETYPCAWKSTSPLFPGTDAYRGKVRPVMSRWAVARTIRRLCRAAGVTREMAWPHALRHTRVTHMLDQGSKRGVPVEQLLPAIAKIVGHRSAWTTITKYLSAMKGAQRAVRESTEELVK